MASRKRQTSNKVKNLRTGSVYVWTGRWMQNHRLSFGLICVILRLAVGTVHSGLFRHNVQRNVSLVYWSRAISDILGVRNGAHLTSLLKLKCSLLSLLVTEREWLFHINFSFLSSFFQNFSRVRRRRLNDHLSRHMFKFMRDSPKD